MESELLENSSLILAAEDCPDEDFEKLHFFSKHENRFISKLIAHGPVLLKGARGGGKSAMMIEAFRNMYPNKIESSVFGIYISLRNLNLLRSEGEKYEKILCQLIIHSTNKYLDIAGVEIEFSPSIDISSVQKEMTELSSHLGKRIVILFDDAAHIGREAPLNEFFDIFRTLSSSSISCKAAIYPGVTKFGTRFDVYNDATVVDISKNEETEGYNATFAEIIRKRFHDILPEKAFVREFSIENVAGFLGRAVLGNMRGFIFACNTLSEHYTDDKVGLNSITKTLISLSSNYYWPLIEELKPKLGIYEPMIEPAIEIAEYIFREAGEQSKRNVIVLREIVQRVSKPFEILEYTGFISVRDLSRAMKSRGRGSRYSLNLCTILENTSGARVTADLFKHWLHEKDDSIEFHRGSELYNLELPDLQENNDLEILQQPFEKLRKSNAYPYGLTDHKIELLKKAGYIKVCDLAEASDNDLLKLPDVGVQTLKRIKSTVAQAIWM